MDDLLRFCLFRSGEVQIQIPYELSDSNSAQLEVLSRGEPVGTASLTVASTAPGIYSLDGTGASTALAIEENGFLNSQGDPAASGWLMTVFLTGEGLTSGTNKTGVAAEAGSTPRIPVSVFLNGQQLQTIAVEELTGMPGSCSSHVHITRSALDRSRLAANRGRCRGEPAEPYDLDPGRAVAASQNCAGSAESQLK